MIDICILAACPSGLHVGLVIQRFWVQVQLWPLGHLDFKSLATLVNSQLVASCQLGFLLNYLYLSI